LIGELASEAKSRGKKRKMSPDEKSFLLEKKDENTIKREIFILNTPLCKR